MADMESKVDILSGTCDIRSAPVPPTSEGMALAHLALILMALVPILLGAFRALKHEKKQKPDIAKGETHPGIITEKKAAMYPVLASCVLYGLYLATFQDSERTSGNSVFSMERIIYLVMMGLCAINCMIMLMHLLSPLVRLFFRERPSCVPVVTLSLPVEHHSTDFLLGQPPSLKPDIPILLAFLLSYVITVCLLASNHWITNNLIGMLMAMAVVEVMHLQNMRTGVILLGGLFFYDIFWVFGTQVMVKVAMSLGPDLPMLLLFPMDILEKGVLAANFSMLGLGDIAVPGVFIAFLLRFDISRGKGTFTYFMTTFFAYFLGLLTTIFALHVSRHAQPALLYLVPACLGVPLLLAWTKGEVNDLFKFESHPSKLKLKKVKKSESKKDK